MPRLVLLALAALACNPPEGKDRTTLLIDLDPTEDGSAVSAMGVTLYVDETARTYSTEMEVTIGGIFQADDTMNIGVSILEGLSQVASGYRRSSEDAESAVWTPDMGRCDGIGYEVQSDEGCEYSAVALVVADRVHSLLMGFSAKVQAPKDVDGVEVDVIIDAFEAEAQPAE